jgi:ABC-type glycerol-3-phosphate transport system substrate-binding protein
MMRLMRMWRLSLVGVLALAACGGDGSRLAADEAKVTSVPEEFHDACGKPGPR